MISLILLVLISSLDFATSLKILVVYPLPVKSVNFLGRAVVTNLLKDGHEVTYITAVPIKSPHSKNFRLIDVSQNNAIIKDYSSWSLANILENKVENQFAQVQDFARDIAKLTFQNENVTKILEDTNEHFDAVLADLLESEVYAGLSVLYNCPMMWFYSMGAHWQVLRLIADPSNPSYDTDYNGAYVPPFTFTQRVQELLTRIRWYLYKTFYTMPAERSIYEQTFGPLLTKRGRTLPDYEEVIYNASMIFANEHNAIASRPSTPQNLKYIGGIHIDDPVKPLPEGLQDLMDNAQHGVIYFSMGSFLKSKEMPINFVRDLLNVFGELKEIVIWKYEDNLKNVPKNVHVIKWAPQQSILAHPNCKFFISHGGLLSTIETINFGIPIVGVPGMFDQVVNINKAVTNGYAIKVNLDYDMPKNLKAAINTMLNNDTYRKAAQELSSIYHDHPMKPGAVLLHWVRHVVRTRGALHMRSPAVSVLIYKRLYLDLIALIIGTVFILFASFKIILNKLSNDDQNLVKEKEL